MANALSVSDGTTTISLSSAGCILTHYVLSTPDLDDGAGNYKPVTETVEFFISDSSIANVQAKMESIERLLQDAVRAQFDECAPVYLYFQTGADTAAWRSEILSFKLLLGEDASTNLYQNRMDCRLIVTRRHYWEGAEVELQLSTSNQSAAAGGRNIVNHDDAGAGHDNWVQIAANQVAGSLPAGVRIQVANTLVTSRTWRMYVAHNALSDPANFLHILEAESRLAGGSIVANGTSSGGNRLSVAPSASTVTLHWTLPASLLQKSAGRMFRVLAVVDGVLATPAGVAQVEIRNDAGTVALWKGDTVPLPSAQGIVDLGAIPLPPGGYSTAYGGARIIVAVTGTGTWYLDFLQLTPTDGIALLDTVHPLLTGEAAVMDGIAERSYALDNASNQLPCVVASGGYIFLHPNRLQRLYFLTESNEAGVLSSDTFAVRVWARPRRLSI